MKLAIIGTVGVPGRYGGFETLADNLVRYLEHHTNATTDSVTVYCSAPSYPEKQYMFHGAQLRYSRFKANGSQSVIYDMVTSLDAICRGHDTLLILGVSGALIIPVLRLVSRARIVTNVDGIEWRRDKWQGLAKHILRWSEAIAARFSHDVIADNQAIADYLHQTYGRASNVIAYGGDHAVATAGPPPPRPLNMPDGYALALCRIEPENNIDMILEAFSRSETPLVFVGNWANSTYGKALKDQYADHPNLTLADPIYDAEALYAVRKGATMYVHGHSAGGTNPALVEMMHFGIPVLAYDCSFNRNTTHEAADYFSSTDDLIAKVPQLVAADGAAIKKIAQDHYVWSTISQKYLDLLSQSKPT